MRAQTQPRKKPNHAAVNAFTNEVEARIIYRDEDAVLYALDAYMRADKFKTGNAIEQDRQTLMTRIYAGMYLLQKFDHEGGGALLHRALSAVAGYRTQAKRDVRKFTPEQAEDLSQAVALIDEMMAQSTLEEQVFAYQYGEGKCFYDVDTYDYVIVEVH